MGAKRDEPRELVSTVHVHQRDEDGQIIQSVIVDNRSLRKVLREHPWVEDELDKESSAHLWRAIPESDDEDDEPVVRTPKASGIPSAFGPGIGDGHKDVELEKPSKGASTAEWAAYADSKGITVGEDAKRTEIIEAVERAEA